MTESNAADSRPQLHIWVMGTIVGDVTGMLMTREGEPLWSHISSNLTWLRIDLTIGFGDRGDKLRARYGDALERHLKELVLHDYGQIPDWLREANVAWAATHPTPTRALTTEAGL